MFGFINQAKLTFVKNFQLRYTLFFSSILTFEINKNEKINQKVLLKHIIMLNKQKFAVLLKRLANIGYL